MKRLIVIHAAWTAFFILMGMSEMVGLTAYHERLPPSGKWIWLIALAGGNLVFHSFMWAKAGWMIDLRQRDDGASRDWSPP